MNRKLNRRTSTQEAVRLFAVLLGCSFGEALFAFAAFGLDMFIKVLFAVVDGDLISGLYGFLGPNPDSYTCDEGFRVGSARVVDVASQVASGATVYGALLVNFKEIFSAHFISLFAGDNRTEILYDSFSGWNALQGEES
jgi:hypothetical protein